MRHLKTARAALFASLGLGLVAFPASAQSMQVYSGDTAWLLTATTLVLLMTIPGLALFYGGLVRTKNALSMLTQVFAVVCVAAIIWMLVGYSLTFTAGTLPGFVGGFSKAFLKGVGPESAIATTTTGVAVPEYAYIAFQMAFACITPAIIVGALAERMRFTATLLFAALWILLVYIPVAHMAWFRVAPDAIAEATRQVLAAAPGEPRRMAEFALAQLQSSAGLFQQWGTLDYAGGTVVHITTGVAGLVGAVMLGKRVGYGRDSMAPHNLTLTITGAALLWVGWLGFNSGSALRADGIAALALLNTMLAPAAGALAWMLVETFVRGKPSALGLVSGVLAGLVGMSPTAGYVGPAGAIAIGLVAGVMCFLFVTAVKSRYEYDDSLDVFGIHCVAGLVGTLLLAVLASPAFGGFGMVEQAKGGHVVGGYDIGFQVAAQLKAVVITVVWSAIVSSQLFRIVDVLVGLRPEEDEEDQGLDIVDHGERAYNY